MRRLLVPFLAAVSLTACAGSPSTSYVAPLAGPTDAQTLAVGITDFMAASLPAASTTLALEPPASEHSSNALTPALTAALRRRGFATVNLNGEDAPSGTRRMRYWVTPMDSGDLVRLTIDGGAIQGNRFFIRNSAGQLQAGGPFTVLGVERMIASPVEAVPLRRVRTKRRARRAPGLMTVQRSVQTATSAAGAAL